MFQLVIENPQTVISVGEKVTFTARLTNLTNKRYTIEHGYPLITLYMRGVDDNTQEGAEAVSLSSVLEPRGNIEQTAQVQPEEAGEYRLRSSCIFRMDGKDYRLKCEDVPITVVEAK